MAQMTMHTLEWVDQSPVQARGAAVSTASPEAVFAILADHVRWPEWFPGLRSVEITGPAEGVGARRRVKLPGLTVDEEFIAWDPGVRWSFTGVASSPRFTRGLVEDCQLTRTANGGTQIDYVMHLDPAGPMGVLVRRSLPRISRSISAAMANLATRALTHP